MSRFDDEDGPRRPLLFERLNRIARPIAVFLAALLVVFLSFSGPPWAAFFVLVGSALVIFFLWTGSDDDDSGYGPGPPA